MKNRRWQLKEKSESRQDVSCYFYYRKKKEYSQREREQGNNNNQEKDMSDRMGRWLLWK